MKFVNKNLSGLILSIYALFVPVNFLFAEGTGINDPLGGRVEDFPTLIKTILDGLIYIGLPVVALAIVYSGFLFVFARGNSEKLTKAKDALIWTIVGAALLLGAWAIAKMIKNTVLGF